MAADNELQVKITADSSGVKAGADKGASDFKAATDQIKVGISSLNSNVSSQMKQVTESFTSGLRQMLNIGTLLGGMIAGILSVAALKGSIDAVFNYREAVERLSRVLGIASEEASHLYVALRMIGVSAETYTSAVMRLSMHVKSDEDALNRLGVATKDTNGHLLTQSEIFNNALNTMKNYKEGTDRNQFALYAFGRGAAEVYELMRLNGRVMEEARAIAQRYGLEISDQTSDKLERYEEKLNVLHIVFDAIKIKIGTELIPELVKLSGWLAREGPGAASVFVGAIKGIISIFSELGIIVRGVTGGLAASLGFIVDMWGAIGRAQTEAQKGGSSAFFDALSKGAQKAVNDFKKANAEMELSAAHTRLEIAKLWESLTVKKETGGGEEGVPKGTKSFVDPNKERELLAFRAAQEAKILELQGFQLEAIKKRHEAELAAEPNEIKRAALRMRQAVEITEFQKKQTQEIKDADIASWGAAADAQQKQADEIAVLEAKRAQEFTALSEAENEKRIENLGKAVDEEEAIEIESKQKIALEEIRLDREIKNILIEGEVERARLLEEIATRKNEHLRSIGDISAKEAASRARDSANERYTIETGALNQQIELWANYPDKYAEILEKMKLAKIKNAQEIQNIDIKLAEETKRTWQEILSPISSAISTSIRGIIMGTQNLHTALRNLFQNILLSFVDILVKNMINEWLAGELKKLTISKIYAAIRTALMGEEAVTTTSIKGKEAMGVISANAGEAASGAAASQASIPWVGPVLAVAAAAAMLSMVLGFKSLVSAAGGWDVDRDQMAMVHKDEMILPADLAEGFRGMVRGGSGAGAPTIRQTNVIQAWDSHDVRQFFDRHGRSMLASLATSARAKGFKK